MKELRDIVYAYDQATQKGKKTALVTLVHLEGSSYRRPGARMLVDEDGEWTGAISGGCLEGDALRKALLVLAQDQPRLVTYDTSNEDDMELGVQLGCSGIIRVLFEPIDSSNSDNPIELIRRALQFRQASVLTTIFDLNDRQSISVGTCLLLNAQGTLCGKSKNIEIESALHADMKQAIEQHQSRFISYKKDAQDVHVFLELVQAPISLIIVGAGNDAIPLSRIADVLGWDVRVVDGRNSHARPERFEAACQVLVSKPEQVLESVEIDARTVFVLMTHNYNYDKSLLKYLLNRELMYIGVLGPKKRLERMLNEYQSEGVDMDLNKLKQVFAPTGLNIGAETPEEIAVSIVAEILSVKNQRPGGKLRELADGIHSRSDHQMEQRNL